VPVTPVPEPAATSAPVVPAEPVTRPEPAEPAVAAPEPAAASVPVVPAEPVTRPEPAEPAVVALELATRPEPATPSSPSADAPEDLLADLRRRWPEIVAWIGRNPANKPLVENCRPVEVRDGFVILGFPEDQPFLREKAEQRRQHLEDGLGHVLGRPIAVRCVVANVELADARDATDDSVDLVAQARRVFGGELADIEDIG
jgi:hypothetical protein